MILISFSVLSKYLFTFCCNGFDLWSFPLCRALAQHYSRSNAHIYLGTVVFTSLRLLTLTLLRSLAMFGILSNHKLMPRRDVQAAAGDALPSSRLVVHNFQTVGAVANSQEIKFVLESFTMCNAKCTFDILLSCQLCKFNLYFSGS